MDKSYVLHEALLHTNHPATAVNLSLAVYQIEKYVRAAKGQHGRIRRLRGRRDTRVSALFAEVHFLLISWARIGKLIEYTATKTRFPRTRIVFRKYKSEFDERIDFRDHLEHWEERLEGEKNREMARAHAHQNHYILGGLYGDHFAFGRARVEVGPKSIRRLTTIYNEFLTAILFDSIETMENDEKRLAWILDTSIVMGSTALNQFKMSRAGLSAVKAATTGRN